ncbi:MAG: PIN domain-containing protein [Chloroflexi bacterium CFX1]|nr:PIN domain-containing protein [Chloroflexi bacterium CFX1]MCK6569405.1 PIN domain-containing protein [Anaerolineales bacterium]
MSGKPVVFVDTNIWLYAFLDTGEEEKSARAKTLLRDADPMLSVQVVNEICVNLIKKAGFNEDKISQLIESFYDKYPIIEMDDNILLDASLLRQEYSFSFWDSLVIACALASNSEVLYSEDMQDGLVVRGDLKIVNPFK